ncbi:hypothetical protein, partial [Limnobacter sp.]|uniref:hypothetical protein n=1 Tax=Limnobacter sp. TaxID=2003368 RepID=UPI002E2F0D25
MLTSLAEVIEKKQGFVLIRSAGTPSAVGQLQRHMNQVKTTALQANDNLCHIVGLKKLDTTEAATEGCTTWMMQVRDESLDMTIDVPVTEITLGDLCTTTSNTSAFETIGKAMSEHMSQVHPAWQDAP